VRIRFVWQRFGEVVAVAHRHAAAEQECTMRDMIQILSTRKASTR
jgi:hypothetical protein